MDERLRILQEEEKPLIDLPALLKVGLISFSFFLGLSLLVFPWQVILFLFLGFCLSIAIFFNLYIGVLVFLAGSYLHPTALFPFLQQFHIARNLAFAILFLWLFHIIIYKDVQFFKAKQNFFVLGLAMMLFLSCFKYFDYSFPQFIEIASKAVILYFVIVNIVRSPKQVTALIWLLIFLAVLSSSVGIYQYLHGMGIKLGGGAVRIFGMTQNPNILAAELVLTVPIIIALFLTYPQKRSKIFLAGFLVIIMLAIVLTFSRAGMATLAFVLILSLMQFGFRDQTKLRSIVYSFLIIMLVILILLPFIPEQYWQRMKTMTDMEEISIASRLEAWRFAFMMMVKNPMLGVGLGVFRYEFLEQALTSPEFKTKFVMLHAHNLYLHTGAEAGVLALIFLLLIIYNSWKNLKLAQQSYEKKENHLFMHLAAALQISLIGFFMMNMVSWHLDLLIFWILVGLSCVLKALSAIDAEV